jgi:hypothetical protein
MTTLPATELDARGRRLRADAAIGVMILVLFTAWMVVAQTAMPSIDLLAGTINGRPLSDWNVDAVTDAFGRPSAVNSGMRVIGPRIHYHEAGLEFWFNAASEDSRARLGSVVIFLSRSWDSEFKLYHQQFRGQLAPAVNGNWKEDRLMREFAEYNPVVTETGKFGEFVRIKRDRHEIGFRLDSTTKFLEHVTLSAR